MRTLSTKVAIVTGGASGIGKAITVALARKGVSTVIADLNLSGAKEIVQEITTLGSEAIAIKTDVSKSEEVNNMVAKTIEHFGRIDILVNNAGIDERIACVTPDHYIIENMMEEEWDKIMNTNLKSMFLCCRAVVKHMKKNRSGKIVSISSADGKRGGSGTLLAYSVSKAGIICLTKGLARYLAPYGINVNSVAPGAIEGTGFSNLWTEKEKQEDIKATPLGRLGDPEDVAEAVLFLVSDKAKYITGEILDVNGGLVMD